MPINSVLLSLSRKTVRWTGRIQPTKVAGTLRRAVADKVAGTLRRAVHSRAFAKIPGGRHMECAYYFVDGTWNVPTTLTFVGCDQ
jgi:hypothetical protein